MRALVTGGTGFIGSHLVDRLVEDGFDVRVPVRKGSNTKYLPQGRVEIRDVDLLDPRSVNGLLRDVELVFHLASIRGSGWSLDDSSVGAVNVGVTRNLLQGFASGNGTRFIYLSSASVYGRPRGGPVEETSACVPVTRYGKSKLESEMLVRDAHEKAGAPTTIIRPVIAYGPRDTWGMIPKLVGLMNAGRYLTVGSGENRIHLIYIQDLIDGLVLAIGSITAVGKTYVLSGERPIRINRLVELLASILEKRVPRLHVPATLGRLTGHLMEFSYGCLGIKREPVVTPDKVDIMCRDRFFEHRRANRDLGFMPTIDHRTGLTATVEWLKAEGFIR